MFIWFSSWFMPFVRFSSFELSDDLMFIKFEHDESLIAFR